MKSLHEESPALNVPASGLAVLALLGLGTPFASAAITVNSGAEGSGGQVRAQAVITDPNGLGSNVTAVAIKEIYASMLIRDFESEALLSIGKRVFGGVDAHGLGRPLGYSSPPFTDPEGPWQGLMWPYRDQYDYFAGQNDPLGDNVGTIFEDQPGVYGILNVNGIARGGPTDPVDPPGQNNPEWLTRGVTGNGLEGPASYFDFNITSIQGTPDRFVRLRILDARAVVVTFDTATQQYGEILVPIPDYERMIQLPEPAAAMSLLVLAPLWFRRQRT